MSLHLCDFLRSFVKVYILWSFSKLSIPQFFSYKQTAKPYKKRKRNSMDMELRFRRQKTKM